MCTEGTLVAWGSFGTRGSAEPVNHWTLGARGRGTCLDRSDRHPFTTDPRGSEDDSLGRLVPETETSWS